MSWLFHSLVLSQTKMTSVWRPFLQTVPFSGLLPFSTLMRNPPFAPSSSSVIEFCVSMCPTPTPTPGLEFHPHHLYMNATKRHLNKDNCVRISVELKWEFCAELNYSSTYTNSHFQTESLVLRALNSHTWAITISYYISPWPSLMGAATYSRRSEYSL